MSPLFCECTQLSWQTKVAAWLLGILVGMALVTAVGLVVSAIG